MQRSWFKRYARGALLLSSMCFVIGGNPSRSYAKGREYLMTTSSVVSVSLLVVLAYQAIKGKPSTKKEETTTELRPIWQPHSHSFKPTFQPFSSSLPLP